MRIPLMILAAGLAIASARMPDGREWTTENLSVNVTGSYCYDDSEQQCQRYGRLYTWDAAQQGCHALGAGWRLPTSDEWRQLAKQFGGFYDDSTDKGHAAYTALMIGGTSGFNAVLGGLREAGNGEYSRSDAHGFYWTSTAADATHAVFLNFGKGSGALYRQPEGEKQRGGSVRCIKD